MYRDTYLEDRVLSASPIELVRMLYDGAVEAVVAARECLRTGDIAGRARAVSKAGAIVAELANSLEPASPELERNLRRLYDYVLTQLAEGNASQTDQPFHDAERVLRTLLEAWQAVDDVRSGTELAATGPEPATLGSGALSMRAAPARSAAAAGQLAVQG